VARAGKTGASGGTSGSRMDRAKQKARPFVWLRSGRAIPSPSARRGLAALAPRAKVGQTVGCSTFTRGAKPATRRVADGDGMTRPREVRAYAPPENHPTGTVKGQGKARGNSGNGRRT
jgi:hypothetical protein